jgi:hypothetical protein
MGHLEGKAIEGAVIIEFPDMTTARAWYDYCLALDEEGVYWIEEPIRHDDYSHLASLAQAAKTTIQIGENFAGLAAMAAALEASASDYVMPDLGRIGGVTGWQRAAGLAAAYNREFSSISSPKSARICLPQRQAGVGRNMWTGRCRFSRSHCRSSTAWRSFPTAPATVCCGPKRLLPNSSSIENMMFACAPLSESRSGLPEQLA